MNELGVVPTYSIYVQRGTSLVIMSSGESVEHLSGYVEQYEHHLGGHYPNGTVHHLPTEEMTAEQVE